MRGGAGKKCRRSSSAFPGSPIAKPGRIKCFEKFLCCFLWKNQSLRAGLGAQGETAAQTPVKRSGVLGKEPPPSQLGTSLGLQLPPILLLLRSLLFSSSPKVCAHCTQQIPRKATLCCVAPLPESKAEERTSSFTMQMDN